MKSYFHKLYLLSPVFIQNILVSIYGYSLYKERYGKGYISFEKELERTENFSENEMNEYQEAKFLEIAREAISNVPYYVNWASDCGITVNDIKSIGDLLKFPIIEKSDIRENPHLFVSNKASVERLIALSTSGSTGSPLTIYCDKETRAKHYAFFTRLREWFGVGKRGGRVTFLGRVVVPQSQKKPPFWRYDFPQNNLLMSAYHLSNDNLQHYHRKILAFKPKEIFGHPSSISRLARYIIESDSPRYIPNVIITTGETLLPYQRKLIEGAFSCPVIDQYGCAEMAFFASQCANEVMHFHPEHAIVEIVGTNNEPLLSGQVGEAVATSLINTVMPLIRYKLGDSLSILDGASECHPAFPVIKQLEGRTDDLIYTKDGRTVGRLSPIFRSDKNIMSAQVIQRQNGDIEVLVVPNKMYNKKNREMIYEESRNRIGDSVDIKIIEVESIDKEPNGKFRPVKSFYKPKA